MPIFKAVSIQRDKKVSVFADSVQALQEGAVRKLGLDGNATYHLYDDSDGTVIDDDECLSSMAEFAASKGAVLLVLVHNGQWSALQAKTPSIIAETPPISDLPPPPTSTVEASNTPVTETPISLRTYVSELRRAVKTPTHIRNYAISKGRRDVVKNMADKLKRITTSPGDMRQLCEKVRASCPEAFVVTMGDQTVECFDQFVKAVYNATKYARETDVCINETPRRRGRLRQSSRDVDDPDAEEPVPNLCLDSNGCVEGMYSPLMGMEDEMLYEDLRKTLLNYNNIPGVEDDPNVIRDMKLTFPLQRQFINKALTSTDWRRLFASWPLLQNQSLFLSHADQLLGKNTLQLWLQEMAGLKTLHGFMAEVAEKLRVNPSTRNRSAVIDQILEDCKVAQETTSSMKPVAIAVFPLLVAYFNEKLDNLLLTVNNASSKENILEEVAATSNCPLLVIKGLSLFDTHATIYLVVRGVFMMQCKDVVEGMLCLLVAYFVFNTCYPKQVARTLEFMQRFFLRINPTTMGRFQGVRAKRGMNALVGKLAGQLADFEAKMSRWTFLGTRDED